MRRRLIDALWAGNLVNEPYYIRQPMRCCIHHRRSTVGVYLIDDSWRYLCNETNHAHAAFLPGGPSQLETLDPKPGHDNGGPTEAIRTAVPGIQVAEHWPLVAEQMKDIALVRSMTNREGNHQRATYQLHTGYAPTGSVKPTAVVRPKSRA